MAVVVLSVIFIGYSFSKPADFVLCVATVKTMEWIKSKQARDTDVKCVKGHLGIQKKNNEPNNQATDTELGVVKSTSCIHSLRMRTSPNDRKSMQDPQLHLHISGVTDQQGYKATTPSK